MAHGVVVDTADEERARPVAGAAMRMDEEIEQRTTADVILGEVDAAIEERAEFAGGEARLDGGKRRHGYTVPMGS
jgi:hypothetical protein